MYRSLTLRGVVSKQSLFDEAFRHSRQVIRERRGRVVEDLRSARGIGIATAFLENSQKSQETESSALLRDFQSYLLAVDKTDRIIAIGIVLQALKAERLGQLDIPEETLAAIDAALVAAVETGVIGDRVDDASGEDQATTLGRSSIHSGETSRPLDRTLFPHWDPKRDGRARIHFQRFYEPIKLDKRPSMGDVEAHDNRFFEAMRQYARYHGKALDEFFPREKGRIPGGKQKAIDPDEAARALADRRERERQRVAKYRHAQKHEPK